MAILCKEAIDARVKSIADAKTKAEEKDAATLIELIDKLRGISDECQDIIDTYAYLRENNLRCPNARRTCTDIYDRIAFNSEESFSFLNYCDYQHLFFHHVCGFSFLCTDSYNGRKINECLDDMYYRPKKNGIYYMRECIAIAKRFLANYGEFKRNFMEYLPQ